MSGKLRKVHACSFEWTILNLSLYPARPGKKLFSPAFTSDLLGNTKWRMILYPKGRKGCKSMSLFIQRLPDDSYMKQIVIDYKITLDSKFRFAKFSGGVCFAEKEKMEYSDFATWQFLGVTDRMRSHDIFTVCCEMSLSDKTASDGRWNQRRDFKVLSYQINQLLDCGRHADFVLVSEGCEFRVHKAILAARSPKFRRELKDVRGDRMDVSSISPSVLREFLSFIYSGKLDIPPNLIPVELIILARVYEIKDLQSRILAFPKAYRARTIIKFEHKFVVYSAKVLNARQCDRNSFCGIVKCDLAYCDTLITNCQVVHDAEWGNGDYAKVSFTLTGVQSDRPVFLSTAVRVVDTDQMRNLNREVFSGHHVFVNAKSWKQTFPIDNFPLVVGDSVYMELEFYISDGITRSYLREEVVAMPDSCPRGVDDLRHFSCDFTRALLVDDVYSDFQVVCGNETLRVHRSVLAARSRVFDRMLEHDMVEKRMGIVVIEDIRPEIVKLMLLYMYSGVFDENASREDVSDLYEAADKYALFVLRDTCRSFLVRNLNAHNVEDVFNLALLHSDVRLEDSIRKFIRTSALASTYLWFT